MNGGDEGLAQRQQALEERERALLAREEEVIRQARAQRASAPHGTSREGVDRPRPLVAENPRRSLTFLLVFLTVLALLGWVVVRGSQTTAKDAPTDPVPFEPRRTAGLNLEVPSAPQAVPGGSV